MVQVGHRDGRRKKTRLEKMLATTQLILALIKGVVNVSVVLSLNPFRKVGNYAYHSNLMFIGPTTERNLDHELLSAYLILLYIYLIAYIVIVSF